IASENGIATLVVTPERDYAITNNIEEQRILDEEIGDLGIEVRSHAWWDGDGAAALLRELAREPFAGDVPLGGAQDVAAEIAALRYSLLPSELERYKYGGETVGRILREVAQDIKPGDLEGRIAGMMAEKLMAWGLIPGVVLVATDERILKYRHPIPNAAKPLQKYAMLVVGGRYKGLCLSATRLVHFGPLDDELRRRQEAVAYVDATLISHTTPGARIGDVFAAGIAAYEEQGFADEWRLHHQGGPTGYAARDYKAEPDCDLTVQPNQAFAWNPSVTGTKSEDTMVLTDGAPEIITGTPDWPMLSTEVAETTWQRPGILVR
ncbi:MAG: M24 family metallopeptidase, partial [Armatimonadota bacterium]